MADTFQWRRCDSGGGSCVDIVGETGTTYVLVLADVGSTIRVSGTRDGNPVTTSAAVGPVIATGTAPALGPFAT